MPAERDEVLDWSRPPDRWRPAPEPAQRPPPSTANRILVAAAVTVGALFLLAVIAAIAMPNLIEARKPQNEAAAIGSLRTIVSAQAVFREGDRDGDGEYEYAASLSELARAKLIDPVLATGEKHGYRFEILGADRFRWSATAVPVRPGRGGDRSFFVDESAAIRFRPSAAGAAVATDPMVGR